MALLQKRPPLIHDKPTDTASNSQAVQPNAHAVPPNGVAGERNILVTPANLPTTSTSGPSTKKRKYGADTISEQPAATTGPLDVFFKSVTADVAAADRARMTSEWRINMEKSKASGDIRAEQAKRQKMEAATQRQRECRNRKVANQMKSGKHDANGKRIHTKVIPTSMPSQQPLTQCC